MKASERRTELIEATVRLITREGLAATSTRAIAAEADMPLSSLHYVFESRDELIALAVHEIAVGVGLQIDVAQIDFTSLTSAVRSMLGQVLEGINHDPLPLIAIYECVNHAARTEGMHDLGRLRWAEDVRMVQYFLGLLALRLRLRWTIPLERLAHMTLTMVEGISYVWIKARDNATSWNAIDGVAALLTQFSVPLEDGEDVEPGLLDGADFAELFREWNASPEGETVDTMTDGGGSRSHPPQ